MTRLTPDQVVATAGEIVEEGGSASLTLAAVAARLGVKAPSLYVHVDGIDDLRLRVALVLLEELAEDTRRAVMGRSGPEALRAIAGAYRGVARRHPGTYALVQRAVPDDERWLEASQSVLEPILAVLAGMGVGGEEAIHITRALRSALHGFVALETGAGFGLDVDVDQSFERLVDVVVAGVEATTAR